MLSPSDTAYPLLKESPTGRELQELFTPNLFELGFAAENTRQPIPRLGLLLLLKSFQKLGYFVRLAESPPPIVLHVAKTVGWNQIPGGYRPRRECRPRDGLHPVVLRRGRVRI